MMLALVLNTATLTWYQLTLILILMQRSFVDRCLGQTMGALVRKKKFKGQLVVRDDATLTKFCDSFRWACDTDLCSEVWLYALANHRLYIHQENHCPSELCV